MAVIDRYLEAMQKQRAEALVFRAGAAVEMVVAGQSRPVSSRAVPAEQWLKPMAHSPDFIN